MCAAYRLSLEKDDDGIEEKLREKYGEAAAEKYRQADIYPGGAAPVVGGGEKVALLKWGFPLSGTKRLVFNARAESLFQKALFKGCLFNRCLVPFTAFYEWGELEGIKRKFVLRPAERLYMAGLWKPVETAGGGREFCFAIITTPPNEAVAAIHSRMPAFILPAQAQRWLDRNSPMPELEVYKGGFDIQTV